MYLRRCDSSNKVDLLHTCVGGHEDDIFQKNIVLFFFTITQINDAVLGSVGPT